MASLTARIVAILLLVLLVGCTKSDEEGWAGPGASEENLETDGEDLLSSLKRRFFNTFDSVTLGEGLFQHEPVAEDLLRQEISPEKLRRFDRDHLQEKAKQIQKTAAESGVTLNPKTVTEKKNIREMGKRFGLSEERIAELEAIAEANRAKDAAHQGPSDPGSASVRTQQPSSPGEVPASAPLVSTQKPESIPKPFAKYPRDYSSEMQDIVQRREERLREALKVPTKP